MDILLLGISLSAKSAEICPRGDRFSSTLHLRIFACANIHSDIVNAHSEIVNADSDSRRKSFIFDRNLRSTSFGIRVHLPSESLFIIARNMQ